MIPSFRFRVDNRTPGHTTFSVFVGQEGQGGNAGKLTLRNDEYDILAPILLAAPQMLKALKAAKDHLEYCGYGDSWERECAIDAKLPEQIEEAIKSAKSRWANA